MNIENENKGNRSFRKQYLAHSFALKTQNYGRFQLLTHNRRERSARLSCRGSVHHQKQRSFQGGGGDFTAPCERQGELYALGSGRPNAV